MQAQNENVQWIVMKEETKEGAQGTYLLVHGMLLIIFEPWYWYQGNETVFPDINHCQLWPRNP